MSSVVVCTVADGDYLAAAGALVNSLVASGFRGPVFIGYRGDLPAWAKGLSRVSLSDGSYIQFLTIASDRNLAFAKPAFILKVADIVPDAAGVVFFDADIVVTAPWRFFEEWMLQGVGLCLDVCYPWVSPLHPWRRPWTEVAQTLALPSRPLDAYFNSGFLSVPRIHLEFVKIWKAVIDHVWPDGCGALDTIKIGDRSDPFHATDQDALAVAAMASTAPLAVIGQEAMGFVPAGYIMQHAVNGPKPWRQNYLLSAFAGVRPGMVDREFWRHVETPLEIFSDSRRRRTKITMRIAAMIGRFYHRS